MRQCLMDSVQFLDKESFFYLDFPAGTETAPFSYIYRIPTRQQITSCKRNTSKEL